MASLPPSSAASLPPSSAADAYQRFDKQALLQIHDLARRHQLENMQPADIFQSNLYFTDPIGTSGTANSLVPLESLNPISLTQLQVGQVHRGRVLYGTLCAEAFRTSGIIMTMLEDDNGDAVRLAMYEAAHLQTNVKKLCPSGAKLAIRDPYFKCAGDGSLAICIDNTTNVQMQVTQKDKCTESLLLVDVEEQMKKGNSCYIERRWDAAAEHYTECIDAALLQLKKRPSSNDNNNINTCLLYAYCNRAETRLQLKEFELALEDSNEGLEIDSGNLEALYRKGLALVGLRQYAAACEYLEKAGKASPGQKEIQGALRQAKAFQAQSHSEKYDISQFLLGIGRPPEVADFVGPVEIKMTEDGRGRGLYATEEISTGQFLLVSNAVAVAYEDNDRSASWTVSNVDHRGNINLPSQEDLVVAVVSAAEKSERLLQQLYSLEDYCSPVNLDVPAIDLFKTQGQISQSQEAAGKEKLQIDVNRIRNIIIRNSFGGAEQTIVSKSKIYEAKLFQRGPNFSGLWLLLSFINHSCLPNSTRMAVGSAMFIHASKPIKRGEEITISYFDTLVPLLQRQARCERWGFKCNCRRCILEVSLKAALELITTRFEQLHGKVLEEINAARSQEHFDANQLPVCVEFAKIFVEAEEIIRSTALLKTEEERNWIRASFVSAYFAGTESDDSSTMLTDCVPSGEIVKAVQNTVPGDIRTLVIAARTLATVAGILKEPNHIMGVENEEFMRRYALEQSMEACIRVFGKHREGVVNALVLKHSICYLF